MTDNKITPPPTALVMFLVSVIITGFGLLMWFSSMLSQKTTGNVIGLINQGMFGVVITLTGFLMFLISRFMNSQPGSMKKNKGDTL